MKTREKILDAIAGHWAEHGFGPTYEDIAAAAGLAGRPTVLYHLRRLRDDGLVDFNDRQSRTVRLTAAGRPVLETEKAKA